VIDNYSRRILSWRLEERLGSGGTCQILREAAAQLSSRSSPAIVVADSGSENVNGALDTVLGSEELTRVLAQVEVTFSNSMIEAFWRSLKHSWLYLHSIDNFTALHRARQRPLRDHLRRRVSRWWSAKASRVFSALLRIGWSVKREAKGSHKVLCRDGFPDFVWAFHDRDEIGPRMLARIAKRTGLAPEDL
jgi:predicted RNA binding protein YcfA (HicA-like mRNA interferase family)